MYHRLIDEYLTHYQPALRVKLERTGTLQTYLEQKDAEMRQARSEILVRSQEREPQLSQLQQELEADQSVRELFLPLP